jgi:DNA-binding NarL/FixJ family response regulator
MSNLCKEINIKNGNPELICVDARTNTPNKNEINQVLGFQNTFLPGLGNVNADNGIVSVNGEAIFKDKGNTLQIQSMSYDAKLHRLYFANFLYLFAFDLRSKKVIDSLVMNSQLCGDRIYKIVAENGRVWVATNQCLHLWQRGRITTLQTEEGPIEGPINDLIVEGNDLYVASLNGVHILRKGSWFLLNKKTGLISDFVKALLLDEKKRLWVAGVNGITVVDLQKAFESSTPKLNINQQGCSFEVDIIGFVRPESVHLQYSLDGLKYKEIQPGFVQFCGHKHGLHKLRFRARKWDGTWTYSSDLTFKIHIPWYKRDWGLLVLVTIVFLLIFAIIFYSLVQSRKRNQHLQSLILERARLENELNDARSNIAKDFHDDMGNKMARISILADILTQADPGDINIRPRLEQIRNDAGDLYKSTRDFIWALKPEHNKLSALITYLTDFGQEYFDSLGIDFETSSNVEHEVDMPYMANRNIIMIGKEAMTNTAKHGRATLMKLSFLLQPDQLIIEWADNGFANSADMENSKRGIANMKDRAAKLKGQLYIVVEGGTIVRLVILPLRGSMIAGGTIKFVLYSLEMKRVVIIEDNEPLNEAFCAVINQSERFRIAGSYIHCEAALAQLSQDKPDVVLMDIQLPGMDGVTGTKMIKKQWPTALVVIITVFEDSSYVFDALCAGATGYLTKNLSSARLIEALEEAVEGGAPMSMNIAKMVVGSFRKNHESILSERETEVITLLAQGKSYKSIGDTLFISRNTIKFHIKNIYEKLQVNSREMAIREASEKRYI